MRRESARGDVSQANCARGEKVTKERDGWGARGEMVGKWEAENSRREEGRGGKIEKKKKKRGSPRSWQGEGGGGEEGFPTWQSAQQTRSATQAHDDCPLPGADAIQLSIHLCGRLASAFASEHRWGHVSTWQG